MENILFFKQLSHFDLINLNKHNAWYKIEFILLF